MNAARTILAAWCLALACGPNAAAADAPGAVNVLIDGSHEWPGPLPELPYSLSLSGIGVTTSHAYLFSQRERFHDYDLIILWQHRTTVPYDELEYGCLLDYLKGGGRVLLVSNAPAWMAANRADSARDYPLIRLARRFGLRLNREHEELAVGAGKVIHQHFGGDTPLQKAFSAKAEDRRAAALFIEQMMSRAKGADSRRDDAIEPEIPIKEAGVTLLYAQPMREGGAWAQKALPRIVASFRESLRSEPTGVVLRGVPCDYPLVMPGFRPEVPLLAGEPDRVFALTAAMFQGWMQPPAPRKDSGQGGGVSYPRWVDSAWAESLARDTLRRFGIAGRYALREKLDAGCFHGRDPNLNAIDLAGPKPLAEKDDVGAAAYDGKCEYVFRTLIQEHGPQVIARFREMVLLYHEAGKLPSPMTSADAVRLLSLAVGKDLFPWFRSLGTKVEPVPLDFTEPDRLRQELKDKAAPTAP